MFVLVLVLVFVLPGFDGELGFGLYGLRQCQFPQIYISEVQAGTDCEHIHGLQILSTANNEDFESFASVAGCCCRPG